MTIDIWLQDKTLKHANFLTPKLQGVIYYYNTQWAS